MRKFPVLSMAVILCAAAAQARATDLYAPTSPQLLQSAPWNWNFTTDGAATTVNASPGTTLDTIASGNATRAGFNISNGGNYNNALMPVISAATGYTVRFQVAVTADQHTSNDRAGFSIISISSDNTKAIELAFFTDTIFSQNSNFVGHGEEVSVNTIPLTTYDLTISGSTYSLLSGNTTLLQGNLRQYNQNANPLNNIIYSQTNWIFMGDDTTSAAGTSTIGHVEVLLLPEPASLSLLGVGAIGLLARRRRV